MGFCRGYSFNTGDLTTCGDVLLNYLEAYESVPWDDLRYMFGEVIKHQARKESTWHFPLADMLCVHSTFTGCH